MTEKRKPISPSRNGKIAVAVFIILAIFGSAIFLALGGPTGLAAQPGIFGTKANLFSDLNLIAQVVLLVGLSLGFVFARQGHYSLHQYNQTGWVFFNIVLTIFIMVVAFVEYAIPGMPGNLRNAYGLVSTIHAALGLLAIFAGVYLLIRMNKRTNQWLPKKWRISWWKRLMRLTLVLYLSVGVIGLVLYYVWYIR